MQNLTENEVNILETEIPENTLDLLNNGNWYSKNPSKILGNPFKASGRFGEVTKYSGDITAIERIDAPENFVGANKGINNPLISVSDDINVSAEIQKPEVVSAVLKAISEADVEIQNIKKTKKKKLEENAVVTPVAELNSFAQTFKNLNPEITLEEVEVYVWYKSNIGKPLSKKYIQLFDTERFKGETERQLQTPFKYDVSDAKIKEWVKKGLLCYYLGELIPTYEYQSGNMYDKKLKLEAEKKSIVELYGEEVADNQEKLLQNAFKIVSDKKILVQESNGLTIHPTSNFAKEFYVERIDILPEDKKFKVIRVTAQSDKDYGKPNFIKDFGKSDWDRKEFDKLNLTDAFCYWIVRTTPTLKEAITHIEIIQYYILGKRIAVDSGSSAEDKAKAEAKKEKIRQAVQKEGDRLFAEFLLTQLITADKERLENDWNATFNNYLPINLNKVPVAFTMAKYVYGAEEIVKQEKRDAVAFAMSNGTAVLSYDVGVGKTPSAIFTISAFIDAGYCKRPVIVVPNQVYRQFISEIKAFAPHIPINEAYNLGDEYAENFKNAKGEISKVEQGTVTIMTYEGFRNVGFEENTIDEIGSGLFEILNQGGETSKETAKLEERIDTLLGRGLKGTIFEIEKFGFDFFCYDEAHEMKKVFTSVKGEEIEDNKGKKTRGHNQYKISSGSPSSIALKGFMINYYILKNNDFKNVLLLTATPFTNSPLEIFSVLSMVAFETLKSNGLENLKSFFDNYVKTSTELVINTKLKPQFKQIILGFNNLISLQSLIRRFVLYKTGDDVGVKRPKKYVLPYLKEIENGVFVDLPEDRKIETYVTMTPQQKGMMDNIIEYVEKGIALKGVSFYSEDIEGEEEDTGLDIDEDMLEDKAEKMGVRTIKGLAYSRNLALSPYLYEFSGLKSPTYKEYINTSPKLKYVMDCVKSVRDYCLSKNQLVAGQVIYMDRGIKYFSLIKEYLVKEVGYKEEEVGIIVSGLPKIGVRSKEYVKNLFNGEIYNEKTKSFEKVDDFKRIKVIIGSSTIKEGMNLQKYGAVLYNCFIDWNPTDIQQLEGRIYRQKNTYNAVRIVNPLVVDSADIFLFQKLMEKTARLNSIWSSDGKTNALNTEEFNPEELKYALIRDPDVIAELKILEEKSKIDSEILGVKREEDTVISIEESAFEIKDNLSEILEKIEPYRNFTSEGNLLSDAEKLVKLVIDLDKKQTDKKGKKIVTVWEAKYLKPKDLEDISDIRDKFNKPYYFSDFTVAVKNVLKKKRDYLDQKNIKFSLETYQEDLKLVKKEIKEKIESLEKEKKNLDEDSVYNRFVREAVEEKERQKIKYKSLPVLVADFSKLNYLLEQRVIANPKKEVSSTCPPFVTEGNKVDISDEALKKMDACLSNEPQTKALHHSEAGYTPQRLQVHKKIINDIFKEVKCVKSDKQPIAIFTGGAPASGKSSFLEKNAKYLLNDNIFKLDADEIRSKLPEYKGWNANSTHLETQDIVNDILERLGTQNCRYDFIYDGTMNKAKKYFPLIKKVKELGYKTYIIFMDVPYAEARKRALQRYEKVPVKGDKTGRYVPMEVIDDFFTEVNGKTRGMLALQELKPIVDGYVVADGVTGNIKEKGGEGIPETRGRGVYTEKPVKFPYPIAKKPIVVPETKSEGVNKNEVMATIKALKYIADTGNKEAEKTIKALKYLL